MSCVSRIYRKSYAGPIATTDPEVDLRGARTSVIAQFCEQQAHDSVEKTSEKRLSPEHATVGHLVKKINHEVNLMCLE